ncbi:hypothetical protein [Limosilactobacillus antri]|uniref:Uncharacterized protein n=1 Tax=Limosilactobacillus antri DSM 16041 TaxID=525309 RepID=C8P969_9LACO|nr:hypothetical protein [Limosilactobacillus antri]EEW52975.1 hypothetical protein HMPREF0494_1863 [Limosilactobacillus antri DSM 16041]KRK56219.1 hypothetical protein FC31_GL001407 [Limosilactobacillus antri DSM 16041]
MNNQKQTVNNATPEYHKLKINLWTGILDVINCILFTMSWFVIFGAAFSDATGNTSDVTTGLGNFFYAMAWIGVVVNIIAIIKSRKNGVSLVGPILGLIGSLLFGLTAALAFPAIVVLIIGAVFTFLQHPAKKGEYK